jgi:hypothetical protein
MIFPGKNRVVSGLAKQLRKAHLVIRQARVELGRSRVVWVATRDDTAAGRAAATDRQIGIRETQPFRRHCVEVRRFHEGIAVATKIIPANIVRDKENEIRPIVATCSYSKQHNEGKNEGGEKRSFHQRRVWHDSPTSAFPFRGIEWNPIKLFKGGLYEIESRR